MGKWLTMTMFFFLTGCVEIYTLHGVWHKMQPGEDLRAVALRYNTELQELAEVNNIQEIQDVGQGKNIYIPHKIKKDFRPLPSEVWPEGEKQTAKVEEGDDAVPEGAGQELGEEVLQSKKLARKTSEPEKKSVAKALIFDRTRFVWPVEGQLTSRFGIRRGRPHEGIDVSAPQGTPIVAAADGKVMFSGTLRGYGNLILIKHTDGFFTSYAHNRKNLVQKGQEIKGGERVALVGRTGRATGSHLHFEVRQGQKARNPLFFLPRRKG